MKFTKHTIILIFLLWSLLSYSQWEWQNPIPHSNSITAIDIIDQDNIWIVAEHGTLSHTTNGGDTWNSINMGFTNDLTDIQFLNSDTAFITGDSGILLRTENAGLSWESLNNNEDIIFTCISYVGNTVWVGGRNDNGFLMYSLDLGENWTVQNFGGCYRINDVFFYDNNIGFAGGDRNYKTINGGLSWTLMPVGIFWPTESIHFTDVNYGWICSKQYIFHTKDGGNTWPIEYYSYDYIYDIYFIDSLIGWYVGDYGSIFKTYNGGINWQVESHEYGGSCIDALNDSILWVGGYGKIHMTLDTTNWQTKSSGIIDRFNNIFFTDLDHGWVSGFHNVIRTDNGGKKWDSANYSITSTQKTDIYFSDTLNGWLCRNGGVLFSDDGGYSWTSQFHPYPDGELWSLCFLDHEYGWAAGSNGVIANTSDGGNNWMIQNTNVGHDLNSIYFPDIFNGWAVGYDGVIKHTSNGGNNWQYQQCNIYEDFYDVFFPNNMIGWVCGSSGTIVKTTDAGENWESQYSNTSKLINAIHFTDTEYGWAVGQYGLILHTQNGGDEWNIMQTLSSNNLKDVFFIDRDNGWICGSMGTIFHTSNGGAVWQEEKQKPKNEKEIFIHPNPFNSILNIDLGNNTENGLMMIYDIKGNLIKTMRISGEDLITLNLSDIVSGVYVINLLFRDERYSTKVIKK